MELNALKFKKISLIILLFLLFAICPNNSYAEELSIEDVRSYVKDTYTIAAGTDALLDRAFYEYSSLSNGLFLDLFKLLIRADEVAGALTSKDYHNAILKAVEYGAELAIRDTIGGSLLSLYNIASLSLLPTKWALDNFYEGVVETAWNNQTRLYMSARSMGYSYEFIINRGFDDLILFSDDGWLLIVGDDSLISYNKPVRPGNYTPEQVYGAAEEVYLAYMAAATYFRDKEQIGTEFCELINPIINCSPRIATAPEEVVFEVSGLLLEELNIVSYTWDFGDNETATGQSVKHFYTTPQNYVVTLTMTDGIGDIHVLTDSLTVRPPEINVSFPDGFESLRREFSTPGSAYIKKYTWNFGDGSPTADGRPQDHTYNTSEYYTVTLTLTLYDDSTIQSQTGIFVGPGTRYLSGHTIYGNKTWYSGGTYVVNGSIDVAQGGSLTIEPGVEVRFANQSDRLHVSGTLIAEGTEDNQIKFTTNNVTPAPGAWQGIYFSSTSIDSVMDHCVVEHGGWGGSPGITFYSSSATVTNSTIRNNQYNGILVKNASPIITGSTISNNGSDTNLNGILIQNASPTITGSTISNNASNGIKIEDITDSSSQPSSPIITGCTISGNTLYGIYYSGSAVIDAANNDWGDPSGPLDDSDDRAGGGLYNPIGLGNKVSNNVYYYPWTGAAIGLTVTPSGLSSIPGDREINLVWDANAELYLGGYKIYYGTASGNYGKPVAVDNVTSFKLTGLTNNTTYYIAISSINSVGAESEKSLETMQTPIIDQDKPTSTITSPSDGESISGESFTITGIAEDGEGTGIQKVEVSTDGGATWNQAVGADSWSYVWVLPLSNGNFTIQSRAADNAGNIEIPGAGVSVLIDNTPLMKNGFNLIAIPADVSTQSDLKDWLPVLGNSSEIEKVMVYDEANNKFITLIPEDGSNPSFTLEGGEGLIVYAKKEKQIGFASVHCSSLNLEQGFNLIGIACPADSYTAYQLLTVLGNGNISSIQRYSTEKGAFETAGFGPDGQVAGVDFPIVSGEGYFLFMKQEVLGFSP